MSNNESGSNTTQINEPQQHKMHRHVTNLTVDASNSVDPNYAHILVYVNCCNNTLTSTNQSNKLLVTSSSNSSYDHSRVIFVLRCLDQILTKCPRDFLASTLKTSLSSAGGTGLSVHNEKLLDLLLRHLKSIHGISFYASASTHFDMAKINFNLNTVTYAETIVVLLLVYIRSFYSPKR